MLGTIIILGLIASGIVAFLGREREIGGGKAFLISLFLSPFIGAIFVATSPMKKEVSSVEKIVKKQDWMEKLHRKLGGV